jgi:NADPH-dependent 2,4-dienoyl-CoA reductase/sulfur reductase-like enzyme
VGGSGPLLLAAADALVQGGARVLMVLEQAEWRGLAKFGAKMLASPSRLWQGAGYIARIGALNYHSDSWVVSAHGDGRVEHAVVSVRGKARQVECDVVCSGFGLLPSVEIALLAGCEVVSGVLQVDDLQETSVPGTFGAGEVCGVAGLENALAQGTLAGLCISGREPPGDVRAEVRRGRALQKTLSSVFAPRREVLELAESSTLLCRCEDVELAAIRAHSEWRQLKLQTRVGMGACQGRTCGGATAAICGHNIHDVRPPIFPVGVSELAGTWSQQKNT